MVVLAPKAFANALPRVIEPGFWRSMEAGRFDVRWIGSKEFF